MPAPHPNSIRKPRVDRFKPSPKTQPDVSPFCAVVTGSPTNPKMKQINMLNGKTREVSW